MNYYQISCNFIQDDPETAKKIINYVKEKYQLSINGCCYKHRNFQAEDEVFYTCQNCRMQLETIVKCTSFYVLIDQDSTFLFPNYEGKCFILQDCFRDKEHKEIQQAIRHLLNKMNIQIIKIENPIDYCGTLYFDGRKISHLPEQTQILKDYCASFNYPVITYCNRCKKGFEQADHEVIHILKLLFP